MKKISKVLAVCACMTALICACGNANQNQTESATETGSETADTAEAEAGETLAETEDTAVYAYDYDVASMVELGEYKGLTYTLVDTSVTDEEVESNIENTLMSKSSREQITDRAVEDGDTVNIDYEGLLDGEAFTGGTAQGASLEIGSGRFIDGFEEGLIGVQPGEEVSLDLTFPETYDNNPDLAGKAVVFNVTVNYIEGEDIIPELDDAFVESLAIENVKTVDAYRNYVKEQLETQKKADADSSRQSELFKKAVENAKVKEYPEELVAQYTKEYENYYSQYAAYFGLELVDFLSQYMDQTEEEFNEDAEKYGNDVAGNMLVLAAIAKAEGIEVTDEFYEEKIAGLLEESGYTDAETLEADYGKAYLKQIMISEAVMDILEQDAKGVEASETEAPEETETDSEE